MPLSSLIPAAISAGVGLYNAFSKDSPDEEYMRELRLRSRMGVGTGERRRLYGEGASQIAGEAGEARRIAGAQQSAMGVGRSSALTNSTNQINAQQSGALRGLRQNITDYDQQVRQQALLGYAEAKAQKDRIRQEQQAAAGQALGLGMSALTQALQTPTSPSVNANPMQYSAGGLPNPQPEYLQPGFSDIAGRQPTNFNSQINTSIPQPGGMGSYSPVGMQPPQYYQQPQQSPYWWYNQYPQYPQY